MNIKFPIVLLLATGFAFAALGQGTLHWSNEDRWGGGSGTLAGFPYANDNLDVDTGSLLGWINVSNGEWIWHYTTAKWMYLPESWVVEGGYWSFTVE